MAELYARLQSAPTLEPRVDLHPLRQLEPRYRVVMLDDQVTTRAFAVELLQRVFHKSHAEAASILFDVGHAGIGTVEVVPLETAEVHVDRAHWLARSRRYPLALSIELAD
jgi:ATP-dependent Clp protease adaptor protein ClpS